MLLSEIVAEYLENLPTGMVLDESQIVRNLRKAVRHYCGYSTLRSAPSEAEINALNESLGLDVPLIPNPDVHSPISASEKIEGAQDFALHPSELAIIRPLFDLYNEWENAQSLEATRGQGAEIWGRTTGEIAMDITNREQDMPRLCFMEPILSI